jgi:hypothetical protein
MQKLTASVVLTMTLCLASCAANISAIEPGSSRDYCSRDRRVMVSKDDKLTPETSRQILTNNVDQDATCR